MSSLSSLRTDQSQLECPAAATLASTTQLTPSREAAKLPVTEPMVGIWHSGRTVELVGRISAPRVSVVVPAMNEADNLRHVLPRLPDTLYEVILVDGHSSDDTIEVTRSLCPGAIILTQPGRGKGDALSAGFAAARGDIIVMLDADGSADPGEIPKFVDALQRGTDFAKGTRFSDGGGSADISWFRRLGHAGLLGLVNWLYGTHYTDLCYGLNAFWAHCLPHMAVDCDGFEVETLIHVRVAKSHLVVKEVGSFEARRIFGSSKLRTVRDGFRVLGIILSECRPKETAMARAMPKVLPGEREGV
jgi:glycosyltransferase involved in cell wall biosynthesis